MGRMIRIERILDDKKKYLDLLLLADEQEDMIEKYLYDGDLYALFDDDLKSVCVVLPIDSQTVELKNLATYPQCQRRGYASALLDRKSTRLNSSHVKISYAVFCLN